MTIELWDVDMPYELQIDCTADGVDIIKISPNTSLLERDENYDICLSKDQCLELARVLRFMAKEIK